LGDTVTALGVVPTANGDPVTAVSAPVVLFAVYPERLLPPEFVTYTNDPFGETATELGLAPAANGAPVAPVNTPVAVLKVYAETLLVP
jgi:hypothetical protein